MPEINEEINSACTVYEPSAAEMGCCTLCDCDISIYDHPDGICTFCDGAAS